MLKKHLLLLILHIKNSIKSLPRIVLCTLVFGLITAVAGICGNSMLGDGSGSAVRLRIAAVMPSGDPAIAAGFSIVSNMDSMKSMCDFVALDREEAIEGLKKGNISAIIEIPPNFADDLMCGVNTPAVITIPENAGTESLLFCSMIDAAGQSLAYSESGIYSVIDLFSNHGMYDYASLTGDELYEYYFKYTLNRGSFFDNIPLSSTGSSSSAVYYICTGIVLMMLLGMLTVTDSFGAKPAAVAESLRVHKISTGYVKICELAGTGLMFFIIFAVLSSVLGLTALKDTGMFIPSLITAVLVVTLSVTSFAMFICSVSDSGIVSVLIIFISSCAMLYASGRIVPGAYLLPWVEKLGSFLPTHYWCSLLESAIDGSLSLPYLLIVLGYTAIFMALCITTSSIRWRKR